VVAALVIVAIGLGSWQLADALKDRGDRSGGHTPNSQKAGQNSAAQPSNRPIGIVSAKDFDPLGSDGSENPELVPKAFDGKASTYWQTSWYTQADFGGLKPGVGIILDLGSAQKVSSVGVDFIGTTSVDLMAADKDATSMPGSLDDFTKVASVSGTEVKLVPGSPVTSRYLLVWLTKLPATSDGRFRGKISEIDVTG
jgi:hypothetical protein